MDETVLTHVGTLLTILGCIDVESSPVIYRELARAHENLVLANELHLLYLVTPLDMSNSNEPSWMAYYKQVRKKMDVCTHLNLSSTMFFLHNKHK